MRISFLKSKTPLAGLEPAIFGLEVQRVVHYAMRAIASLSDYSYTHPSPNVSPLLIPSAPVV